MDVREVYQRIQALQDEIAALGPLDPDVRKRIDYKFRLDWNYHSNNIEGGTLTVAETKSIMLGHVTVEDKPLKDILEMRGHDQTVKAVMAIGKGEVQLSEKRIKEIHAAIIHEDEPSLKSSIGKWKTLANEIKNPRKGVTFRFCEPDEVPDAIHKLLDWFKAENEKLKQNKSDLPAPRLAFEFHLRFLTIHPFHDGNGRVGRILLNLILISMGYPPIIINNTEKPRYEDLLTEIQVNGAPQNDLWIFLGGLLIRSLELVKRAIDGEELDLELTADERWKRMEAHLALIDESQKIQITLDQDVVSKMVKKWVAPLFAGIAEKFKLLEKHFVEIAVYLNIEEQSTQIKLGGLSERRAALDLIVGLSKKGINFTTFRCHLYTRFESFIPAGEQAFQFTQSLTVNWNTTKYIIAYHRCDKDSGRVEEVEFANRLLHKEFSELDRNALTDLVFGSVLNRIEYDSRRLGIL